MQQFDKTVCKLVGLLALGIMGCSLPAQSATYYVKPNGASTGETTEANALNWEAARQMADADPLTNDTIIFLPGRYDRTNVGNTYRNDSLIIVPTNTTIKAKNRAQDTPDTTQRSALVGIFNTSGVKVPQWNYIVIEGDNGQKKNIVIDGFEIDGSAINVDTAAGRSYANGIFLKNDCRNSFTMRVAEESPVTIAV